MSLSVLFIICSQWSPKINFLDQLGEEKEKNAGRAAHVRFFFHAGHGRQAEHSNIKEVLTCNTFIFYAEILIIHAVKPSWLSKVQNPDIWQRYGPFTRLGLLPHLGQGELLTFSWLQAFVWRSFITGCLQIDTRTHFFFFLWIKLWISLRFLCKRSRWVLGQLVLQTDPGHVFLTREHRINNRYWHCFINWTN